VAQARSNTQSCQAIKRYQNYQRDSIVLSRRLIASRSFVCEEEDVLVARSCKEKDVVVDCLFWQNLQRRRVTFHKTIIFFQASTNDKILRHEGV
jgi:hypothetical protein